MAIKTPSTSKDNPKKLKNYKKLMAYFAKVNDNGNKHTHTKSAGK
jgi:hypothetical protein